MKPIKLLEIFCIDVKLFDEQEKESKRMKKDYSNPHTNRRQSARANR